MKLLLAGSTSDALNESLTYSLPNSSEFLVGRRMARFYPSGASSYSASTTTVARIDLKGQGGFLDMSTLKIAFCIVNNSATLPLIVSGDHHALISRIRCFCQNSLIEDCSHYARNHQLLTELLSPTKWRIMHANESNLKQLVGGSTKDPASVQVIDPG